MHPLEFMEFAINNWLLLMLSISICILSLLFLFGKYSPLSIYDPFHFFFSFTMGTTYGEFILLYFKGYISDILFWKIFSINIVFIFSLLILKKIKIKYPLNIAFLYVHNKYEKLFFYITLFFFFSFSLFLLIKTGPLIFYESRFEAVKGLGAFKRIFDVLRLFVIGMITIKIVDEKNKVRKIIWILFLLVIILFSSILNGAKFAFLESFYIVLLSYTLYKGRFKISLVKAIIILFISTIFALFVLYEQSIKSSNTISIYGINYVVLERFVHRVLDNGNQMYMLLPNDVIENIKVNNPVITFVAPFVGSTNLSKLLGYNVNDYTVGRQAILYYYPSFEIAGGPTSHFDLFAYKYFGYIGAFIFTIIIAFILNYILFLVKYTYSINLIIKNRTIPVIVGTLWLRGLAIILEPSIGIAHIFDVIIVFFILKAFTLIIGRSHGK